MKRLVVKVDNPTLSEMVQLVALKNNYKWEDNDKQEAQYLHHKYLCFSFKVLNSITFSARPSCGVVDNAIKSGEVELLDASTEFGKIVSWFQNRMWKIGDYDAYIEGDVLKVGCIDVPKETIIEIYEEITS